MVREVTAVVAAAAPNGGIGYQGKLPWKLPADLKHFQRVTTSRLPAAATTKEEEEDTANCPSNRHSMNAVIMGRKTWDSIPPKFRPLPGRINVILSRNPDFCVGGDNKDDSCVVWTAGSLEAAVAKLEEQPQARDAPAVGQIFVIGGAQVYEQAIAQGIVNKVIYTQVSALNNDKDSAASSDEENSANHNKDKDVVAEKKPAGGLLSKMDAFFPPLPASEWDKQPYEPSKNGVDEKAGLAYEFWQYTRKTPPPEPTTSATCTTTETSEADTTKTVNTEEMQYLDLCRDIIDTGICRGDRTGTGTLSKFGTQMRFNLRDGTLPLLTTKRTFWRGVAEELLWFISGSTNAAELSAKKIHIWDGNGSREFLDSRGLAHRQVGDLGPVYGFQWRHFGAAYHDMHTNYDGQGVDQLQACIDKIIHHPEDRRILLSAWNPADLDLMALPPCHMFCQFYVDTDKNELSCQMYQRSADMGLGVPFNIASYALLTHMMAQVTGRKPGDFVHTIGDAHVYLNHVDALKEQLTREPRAFPKLRINPEKKNIDDFEFGDFEVIGYNPHKPIKMKMAV